MKCVINRRHRLGSHGSELIALLRESFEIKDNKPFYNRHRESQFSMGIYTSTDRNGYIIFNYLPVNTGKSLSVFTSKERAKSKLESLTETFNLCQKLTGLYESDGPCFQFHVGICKGACCGKEPPQEYNGRAGKAIEEFIFSKRNSLLSTKGGMKKRKALWKL